MKDEMRERYDVQNPPIEVLRSTSEKLMVSQSIDEVGQAISRYSVDPESVRKAFGAFRDSKLNDAQIAEGLGKIELFDKELQNIDLSTDDGLAKATAVADGKLISTIEATTDKKFKIRLQKFRDYILDKTGAVIVKVGRRKGAVGSMVLLVAAAVACSPFAVGPVTIIDGETHPTATETSPQSSPTTAPTKPETQIPTKTATQAATKTPTATTEASPTAEPWGLRTEFKGDYLKNLPIIKEEDITSGAIALKEQELLASGVIAPFSENAMPFPKGLLRPGIYKDGMTVLLPAGGGGVRTADEVREEYTSDKDKTSLRVCDLAIVEIDGQKMLMMGVGHLNLDKSVKFLHYTIQDYESEKNIKAIKAMVSGEYTFWPIAVFKSYPTHFPLFDYSHESIMLGRYKNGADVRKQWLALWAGTGVMPDAMQKALLLPLVLE